MFPSIFVSPILAKVLFSFMIHISNVIYPFLSREICISTRTFNNQNDHGNSPFSNARWQECRIFTHEEANYFDIFQLDLPIQLWIHDVLLEPYHETTIPSHILEHPLS